MSEQKKLDAEMAAFNAYLNEVVETKQYGTLTIKLQRHDEYTVRDEQVALDAWLARASLPVGVPDQGERQKAQVMGRVHHNPEHAEPVRAVLNSIGRQLPDNAPLYADSQPGPDVRGMAAFALELIDGAGEGGSFAGGDIQEAGVRHGLLVMEQREESCGEHCDCAEYGFPAECYRLTPAFAAHRQARRPGDVNRCPTCSGSCTEICAKARP